MPSSILCQAGVAAAQHNRQTGVLLQILRLLLCSADEVWAAMHQKPSSHVRGVHPSDTGVQATASRAATLRRDTPSPVTLTHSRDARGGAAARQERFASAGIPEQEVSAPLCDR